MICFWVSILLRLIVPECHVTYGWRFEEYRSFVRVMSSVELQLSNYSTNAYGKMTWADRLWFSWVGSNLIKRLEIRHPSSAWWRIRAEMHDMLLSMFKEAIHRPTRRTFHFPTLTTITFLYSIFWRMPKWLGNMIITVRRNRSDATLGVVLDTKFTYLLT